MSEVGNWTWAQRTDGRLGKRDRAELLRQGILARLAALPVRWRRQILPEAGSLELPTPPDTPLAAEAEQRVRELSTPELYGHCLRTWAFAALFAQRDRVEHDEELLYVACVLHDLGLTDAHEGADPTAMCFAVEGARAAHALVCDHGETAERARTVAEAISLHLNVDVHQRYGSVATLLSKGVMLDVVGRRVEQLPEDAVSGVSRAWPREGAAEVLVTRTKHQAAVRPQSRAALLHRLGFVDLVFDNPLDHA